MVKRVDGRVGDFQTLSIGQGVLWYKIFFYVSFFFFWRLLLRKRFCACVLRVECYEMGGWKLNGWVGAPYNFHNLKGSLLNARGGKNFQKIQYDTPPIIKHGRVIRLKKQQSIFPYFNLLELICFNNDFSILFLKFSLCFSSLKFYLKCNGAY